MSEPIRDPRHTGSPAETLSECLQAIESGRATPESCVAAHPELAELETLLRAVSIVQELPRPLLPQATKVAMRSEVLAKYRASARPVQRARKPFSVPGWFRVVLAASLVVAILLGGGTGLVRAADNAIPGDSLYGVKRFAERVQQTFADSASHSAISYGIAEKRLSEVTALTARNLPISDEFLTDVADSINVALAVQLDAAQRASLIADAAKAIDQAQSAGVITTQAKDNIFTRLGQPPIVLAPPPTSLPTDPPVVATNISVPSATPTVQVASATVVPTTNESATPTEDSTEVKIRVAPLIAKTSTPTPAVPTKRPTVVKPRPTRAKATPSNPDGNSGNNGNANGNNAGGNGNGNANGGNGNNGTNSGGNGNGNANGGGGNSGGNGGGGDNGGGGGKK